MSALYTYECEQGHETEVELVATDPMPSVECHECGKEAKLVMGRSEPNLRWRLLGLLEKWELEASENAVKEADMHQRLLAGEQVQCTSSNIPKLFVAEHYISDLRSILVSAAQS